MGLNMVLLNGGEVPAGATGVAGIGGILYLVIIFGIMWFFIIRPQRKRQKAIQEMQSAISVGDWIMTSGGMFGKVVDTVNDICVVEFGLNKGIRIPVQRDQIASVKEPDMTVKKEEVVEEKEEKKENKKEDK